MFGDVLAYLDVGCFDALLLICVEDAEHLVSTEAAYWGGKILLFLHFLCEVPIVVVAEPYNLFVEHYYEE